MQIHPHSAKMATTASTTCLNRECATHSFSPEAQYDSRPHAVIIGAGLGGLSSGIHLLREGWRVTLLEKNQRVGGRMNVLEERGFRIDMGPTLLMMPEVIEGIFESCGRNVEDYIELQRVDPAYRIHFSDDSCLSMQSSIEALQQEVARIAPQDAPQIPALFAAMRRQYENARGNFIEQPFNGIGSLLRPQTLKGLATALPITNVYKFVSRYVKDERLRQAFTFQTLYLGISPMECPSIYSLLPYIELTFGVWFPKGGMIAIAEGLARLFREMGGELYTGVGVQRVMTEGRRACGVVVDNFLGSQNCFLSSDVVVSNLDASTTYTRLVPASLRRKYADTKLASKEYGCSAHLLYLGVKELPKSFMHHEVFLSKNYEQTLREITDTKVIPEDPALYTCIPTRSDPSLAPVGHDVLYILTPCPHMGGDIDWKRESPRLREKVLDKLERAGFEGLREKIVFEREFTPPDFERAYGCYMGSAFGMSPTFFQSSYFRPQMRSEEIERLYCVGAGTHPGGGVPIVLTSGRLAASTVVEDWVALQQLAGAR